MRFLLIVLSLLMAAMTYGQSERPWEQALADVMTAEDLESATWEDTYNMLCELEEQPIDLNKATREELEALPFLTDRQVEDIMEYRYRYGAMKSMNELRMIRSLDSRLIDVLRYFTFIDNETATAGKRPLKERLQYGHHELMAYGRIPFYERRGDKNGYEGYPYRHWLRYRYNLDNDVKIGFVGSQDAGEPFFANTNKAGYDFYSYYLQVRRLGCIENAVVGKFKLSVGMGLVLNNSFGMGKLATLQQLGRSTNTVRPHSSRSQTDYMQGAAATFNLSPRWQLTAFLSYRPLDATLNDDGSIRTIVTGGYHRTPTEIEKKNNSHATDGGTHIAYRRGGLHAGATAVYTHLDRDLSPDTRTLYRRYNAQGNNFLNLSADYGYLHPRFALNGETAMNRDGAIATINSLSVEVSDELSLMLMQRFYSYRYTALYARSLSEGGHVQNESGYYFGLTWNPSPRLSVRAYTDYAYFAWARYQVSQPSHSWDNLLNATYSRGEWSITARYRLHLRQKDDDSKTALVNTTEHRGRIAVIWQHKTFSAATQADGVSTGSHDRGYSLSETVGWNIRRLKLNVNAGYFHTDSYDSRIYTYERGPLYTFSFPSFYGEGMRGAVMAQLKLNRRLSLTAKLGYTHYFDRSAIGSGLQQIDHSSQTDLDLQARWTF
ncbi:MAG: helix-hairpin-helix domain-containing protein [Prevotella sp.]|jgi:hypothetical protein|nr:helix-hairpin-helix domain-containing protein [Prevotella sp.]